MKRRTEVKHEPEPGCGMTLMIVVVLGLIAAAMSALLMVCWNTVIPVLTAGAVPPLTYWQAAALFLLASLVNLGLLAGRRPAPLEQHDQREGNDRTRHQRP